MAKFITRTIVSSTLSACKIETVEGKPEIKELEPFTIEGSLDVEKAQKAVTKKYGQGATLTSIEESSKMYKMEVSKFVELAEEVKAEETEEETAHA